jgi:dephospho-CoA kinase
LHIYIVVEPGHKAWRKIHEIFGPTVFDDDGKLNRKRMGQLIFGDAKKRSTLNSITHLEIAKEIVFLIFHYFTRGMYIYIYICMQ